MTALQSKRSSVQADSTAETWMAVAFSMNVVTATYWFPHCTSCGQTETNTAVGICTMMAFAQCKCALNYYYAGRAETQRGTRMCKKCANTVAAAKAVDPHGRLMLVLHTNYFS